MARTPRRRSLRLERLESREVMTAGGPSGEVQAMIERINVARANPTAALDWALSDASLNDTLNYYGVDRNALQQQYEGIASRPPLAWDASLNAAAQGQSDHQAAIGQQTHSGANGMDLSARIQAAGYTNMASDAENAYAYAQSTDHAMESFLLDWGVADQGHMKNMLQPDSTQAPLTDVGIGITKTSNAGLGPDVVTVDFARHQVSQPQLLGVAYKQDADGYYKAGEGVGNVEVDAVKLGTDGNPTGPTHTVETWDASGAYQMPLDPGTYAVTASFGGKVIRSQQVNIGSVNVKVDYQLNGPWQGTATTPAATLSPAPAPAVAPAVISAVTPAASTPPPAASSPNPSQAASTPTVVAASTPAPTQAAMPASPSGWSVSYTYGPVISNWVGFNNN